MYDVYSKTCPSRTLLNLVADPWTVLVVGQLAQGTHRFNDLRMAVGGISQKMLSQTLRALERAGLVKRTAYSEIPPRVEYSLTPLGRTLRTPMRSLSQWAEQHAEETGASHLDA